MPPWLEKTKNKGTSTVTTRRVLLLSAALLPFALSFAQAQEDTGEGWVLRPFMMEDVNGAVVNDDNLRGHFSLVFFGYTSCPDICPTTLLTIATALKALKPEEAERVLPLFVSLDPNRDTRKVLSEYVSAFDPRIVALRGPKPYTDATARVFGVEYKAVTPDPAKPDEYSIDHTATIAFLDPDGGLIKKFSNSIAADALAGELRAAIAAAPPSKQN